MWLQSLLVLAFTTAALSFPSTLNDPFRALARQAPKRDDGPQCCLRPLSPPEGTEDDVLLSFEEWKERQLVSVLREQRTASVHPPSGSSQAPAGAVLKDSPPEPTINVALPGASHSPPVDAVEALVPDAPYFRIPLTDRFNYASTDCSARVHTAHKSAKSPASILSSKKDRYMLSPCNDKNQFVVVELCDDIRIDTVQMANYEFFSGVFKDFTVSVAKTYTTDTDGWVVAGTYRGKNTRGIQSFHPPTTLGDFYRFIRIDFHSHYGSEFYCPLSILRVYGLTHLEHWKWDLWESESRARRAVEGIVVPAEVSQEPPQPVKRTDPDTAAGHPSTGATNHPGEHPTSVPSAQTEPHSEAATSVASSHTTHSPVHVSGEPSPALAGAEQTEGVPSVTTVIRTTGYTATISGSSDHTVNPHPLPASQTHILDTTHDSERRHITDSLYNSITIAQAPSSHSVSLSLSAPASPVSSQNPSFFSHSSAVSSVSINQAASSDRSTSTPSASTTLSQSLTIASHTPPSSGGESIYRTIMNRLTALETNTSLYARFVEDHTANVRDMLRKLGEDVGRLEGLGKAQAQTYQRSVSHFEQQQQRLELQHIELLQRVNHLTDEVILEKRLGIAQLCLLLAVLVFMALTRGSRHELIRGTGSEDGGIRSRTSSLRGWGRRTLSISGDWVNRFTSRSRSDSPVKAEISQSVQASDGFPRSKRVHPVTGGRKLAIVVRPRTPTAARSNSRLNSPAYAPSTPTRVSQSTAPLPRTGPRPPIQRSHSSAISQSFSMGMMPPGPKSAKHWARTAHLHEVKSSKGGRPVESATPSDILAGASTSAGSSSRDQKSDNTEDANDWHREESGERARYSHSTLPAGIPSRGGLPEPCEWGGKASDADASEGEVWIDTDADDSESDVGILQYGVK
ncbi:hypothetical protein BDW22DRAFT_886662 [Trametopsis cervina]|nr:hypothetical protein BDW22DRAFT_886662 [Trametopsis cervina]